MARRFFDLPFSKWHVFAREFILHIENELYNPPMKLENANFIEENAAKFIQARNLFAQYPAYLGSVVEERIKKEVSYHQEILIQPNWAIFLSSPKHWGNAQIWLCYQKNDPQHYPVSPDGFDIWICPNKGELKLGKTNTDQDVLLKNMEYFESMACFGGEACWKTIRSFKNRDEAISFIIPLIELLEPAQKNQP